MTAPESAEDFVRRVMYDGRAFGSKWCLDQLQTRDAAIRKAAFEEAKRIVDAEGELVGVPPPEIYDLDRTELLRATVRATKKSIRSAIAAKAKETP